MGGRRPDENNPFAGPAVRPPFIWLGRPAGSADDDDDDASPDGSNGSSGEDNASRPSQPSSAHPCPWVRPWVRAALVGFSAKVLVLVDVIDVVLFYHCCFCVVTGCGQCVCG